MKNWKIHRTSCGKTDRISLNSFYPFLACLVEAAHMHIKKPRHIARSHVILNNPEDSRPVTLPDGSGAIPLVLGDRIWELPAVLMHGKLPPPDPELSVWWPTAASPDIQEHMLRRIRHEGYTLQLATSVCIGLLREMYTTTFVRASDDPHRVARRRVRLQHRKSPISDFGVVKGNARVEVRDRLAYLKMSDGILEKGQDPGEHYWIYFTTLSGEEVTLDCGLYPFNFCPSVRTDPYILPVHAGKFQFAPAHFLDLEAVPKSPLIAIPIQKFSVLRNEALQKGIQDTSIMFQWDDVFSFMESISGAKTTPGEEMMMKFWTLDNCGAIKEILRERSWERWPAEPHVEIIPDKVENLGPILHWAQFVEEWNRTHIISLPFKLMEPRM